MYKFYKRLTWIERFIPTPIPKHAISKSSLNFSWPVLNPEGAYIDTISIAQLDLIKHLLGFRF